MCYNTVMENKHTVCSVSKTIKVIGSKWTLLIIHVLFEGTKRFGQLQKQLFGISPKTLSERLKALEKEGILSKKVFAEIPLRVEYSLTAKGRSLEKIFRDMAAWGEKA